MYIIGINPAKIDDTQMYTLGTLGATPDGVFRYVRYWTATAGVAAAALEAVAYMTIAAINTEGLTGEFDPYHVTRDYSDTANQGAGIVQAAMTDGQYGWVQTAGLSQTAIALGGTPTAGDALTIVGAADGALQLATLADNPICATARKTTSVWQVWCQFP